jgi:hypothetical protein
LGREREFGFGVDVSRLLLALSAEKLIVLEKLRDLLGESMAKAALERRDGWSSLVDDDTCSAFFNWVEVTSITSSSSLGCTPDLDVFLLGVRDLDFERRSDRKDRFEP